MSQTLSPSERPEAAAPPQIKAFSHIDLTVTNVDASAAWYQRVFGLSQHRANQGEAFAEHRTGLDHVSFLVAGRDELEAWQAHLERLGVSHSPTVDVQEPFPYSVLVFRDPDNIQLELISMGGPGGA